MKEEIPIIRPYNPLDKRNLAESTAEAMLQTPIQRLPPEPFIGAGVYAIYYRGDFPLYRKISLANSNGFNLPIYVGKAVPAGARKGGLGFDVPHGKALYSRLTEHYESVSKAENLNEENFYCRFLVLDDFWIPLIESLLIAKFRPVWNQCMDGFGNHDPGKGRYNQQRSPWDCIHPGREWAARLQDNRLPVEELIHKVEEFTDQIQLQRPSVVLRP